MHMFLRRCLPLTAVTLVALVATGCVPYVQHQKVTKALDLANSLNRDLERALGNARRDFSANRSGSELMNVTINAKNQQIEGLQMALDDCREANSRLEEQIAGMPTLPMPGSFSQSDASATGLEMSSSGALILRELNFDSGKSGLKPSQRKALDELARLLKTKYAGRAVYIEGHTDVVPVKKTASVNKDNWFLSVKRAHAVFDYLTKEGVKEEFCRLHGYGYSVPAEGVVDETSEEGKKQCRRVEVRLGR